MSKVLAVHFDLSKVLAVDFDRQRGDDLSAETFRTAAGAVDMLFWQQA